jgi:hypothetical protein
MEQINQLVILKIDSLKDTAKKLDYNEGAKYIKSLDIVLNRFLLCSTRPYAGNGIATLDSYINSLSTYSIFEDITEVYNTIKTSIAAIKKQAIRKQLEKQLELYPKINTIEYKVEDSTKLDNEKCTDCQTIMSIDTMYSNFICPCCGIIKPICGITFDDPKLFSTSSSKSKVISRFNKNEHLDRWLLRICAQEGDSQLGSKEPGNIYGENYIKIIREKAINDGRSLKRMNVTQMRKVLEEVGLTRLYSNVPLLLKKITGYGPPELPNKVRSFVKYTFSRIIDYNISINTTRRNEHYYPYYIMKLLDIAIDPSDRYLRTIFFYIYIQGRETIIKNDREWFVICNKLGLKYNNTDENLPNLYLPYVEQDEL